MNKREFLKEAGLAAAYLLAPALLYRCSADRAHRSVMNWHWIHSVGDTSVDDLKFRLEELKNHGIDAVLMETFIDESTVSAGYWGPLNHPPLERLIRAGEITEVSIHCWLWQMPNNIQFFAENHGDWFAVNGKRQPAHTHPAYVDYYRFMCPNHPEVKEYLRMRIKSACSIKELAGIHLDYIRFPDVILAEALQPVYNIIQDREYPEYDYCYCDNCRRLFREQTGIDHLTGLDDPSESREWRQFRYDSITNLVNTILAPEVRKAGKTVTAAVFPNWESVRQEWRNWDLDAFFPMLYHNFYNADIDWIGENISKQLKELRYERPLYSGLYLPAMEPGQLMKAFHLSVDAGAAGISLFGNITEEHFRVLAGLKA